MNARMEVLCTKNLHCVVLLTNHPFQLTSAAEQDSEQIQQKYPRSYSCIERSDTSKLCKNVYYIQFKDASLSITC